MEKYPCENCLIKTECKDPCDKTEGIIIYGKGDEIKCPFCGDEIFSGSYIDYCTTCESDIKSIKNKTKIMEKIYKGVKEV